MRRGLRAPRFGIAYRSSRRDAPAGTWGSGAAESGSGGTQSAMTWYPIETQPRDPSILVKVLRTSSALLRWGLLVALAGLVLALAVGLGATALFTAIDNGL